MGIYQLYGYDSRAKQILCRNCNIIYIDNPISRSYHNKSLCSKPYRKQYVLNKLRKSLK